MRGEEKSESMKVESYRDLLVWQKAIELVKEIYSLVAFLPKKETFALSDQMRRAVVSIPSNIAEGKMRTSVKEYSNFLSIALGSNGELDTQLIICNELGYLDKKQCEKAFALIVEIRKMLLVMKKHLVSKT